MVRLSELVVAASWPCCLAAVSGGGTSTGRYAHVLEGPFLRDAPGEGDDARAVASRLTLYEAVGSKTGEWSGHRIWPAALALVEHLHQTRGGTLAGLRILELGCGLPLVGAALAALGAEVCATDHPDALPHVEAVLLDEGPPSVSEPPAHLGGGRLVGLTASARGRLRLRPLAWGAGGLLGSPGEGAAASEDPAPVLPSSPGENFSTLCGFAGPVDLLIGADLVYDEFPLDALQETITAVLRENGASAVLALQARRFPMVKALQEPQRLRKFLRSLAAQEGWEVAVSRPGPGSLSRQQGPGEEAGSDPGDSLILATLSPLGARGRGRAAPSRQPAAEPGFVPLRYVREELQGVGAGAGERGRAGEDEL